MLLLFSYITFYCDEGYYLSSTNDVYCQGDSWDSTIDVPICMPYVCPEVDVIMATVSYTENRMQGSRMTIVCEEGYEIESHTKPYCFNGEWDREYPEECTRKFP